MVFLLLLVPLKTGAGLSPYEEKQKEIGSIYGGYYPVVTYKGEIEVIRQERLSHRTNCVRYARSVQKSLPNGLSTLQAKRAIIRTQQPCVHCVAITNEGYAGHLSIVEEVYADHIVVSEENYRRGYFTERKLPLNSVEGFY